MELRICVRSTYYASVVNEVVETDVAENRLKILCGRADAGEVADIELDDVQRPLCGVLQIAKCGRLLWGANARDDEIGRNRKQLPYDLEADAATGSESIWEHRRSNQERVARR